MWKCKKSLSISYWLSWLSIHSHPFKNTLKINPSRGQAGLTVYCWAPGLVTSWKPRPRAHQILSTKHMSSWKHTRPEPKTFAIWPSSFWSCCPKLTDLFCCQWHRLDWHHLRVRSNFCPMQNDSNCKGRSKNYAGPYQTPFRNVQLAQMIVVIFVVIVAVILQLL